MNNQYPVFTIENECLDCYKCVRGCPVKAIRISDGHASVIPEKCIACGKCIALCPQKAKKVRTDISIVQEALSSDKKVYASIAPSWRGSFSCSIGQLTKGLKRLGFSGVSETALGAQEVSIETAKILRNREKSLWISSACPAVVDYIRMYQPLFAPYIIPLASPAVTHGRMLKERFGDDLKMVFIGPCTAKKNEADQFPDLMDAAIGFDELLELCRLRGIDMEEEEEEGDALIPCRAHEGSLYPMEGGMNETLHKSGMAKGVRLINVSTISMLHDLLQGLDPSSITEPLFIEAMACKGGCFNGPLQTGKRPGLIVISDTLKNISAREKIPREARTVVAQHYAPTYCDSKSPAPALIRKAMARIGKNSVEDELNCGGCGYNTCRDLAIALVSKTAEPHMCSSYMRKIAARKAGAVFNCMPSGILMVDRELKILETNKSFVRMFAEDLLEEFDSEPDCLGGARLDKVIPCTELFESALETNKDIHKEHYPMINGLYEISIFSIEPHHIVGAVIADVTKYEMRRDQIAKKAHSVIAKNIAIVQDIACSLGEHMVETELLLTSIAEGYDPDSPEREKRVSEKRMDPLIDLVGKYE